ncbi:hypothetical protein P0082_07230 [Candidatus Haliotispira prima]|uniref:Uncharacterized protein n=1 Tax=Candidatus Haliotispira prima TaxID=3034016 RepID=A0ABY8MHF1_9SPIO|nr:hypothetical protein P0082_07230 [Candidatus Haliotispira prima]
MEHIHKCLTDSPFGHIRHIKIKADKMKKTIYVLSVIALLGLFSCNQGSTVLLVEIDPKAKPSSISYIKKALNRGGYITLNIEAAREIDKHFDTKYAVSNEDGKFPILPVLLNFVGGHGWKYKERIMQGDYVFVR